MTPGPSVSQWALAIAAIVSAIGAWLGFFVQNRISSRQIRATVVSANRQTWIDALREDVSEILSILWAYDTHMHAFNAATHAEQLERFELEQRANLVFTRIRLRLNPNEQPALDLIGSLQALIRPRIARDAIVEERIVELTQGILKSEWSCAKRGE